MQLRIAAHATVENEIMKKLKRVFSKGVFSKGVFSVARSPVSYKCERTPCNV